MSFESLKNQQYMNLITFRKSGQEMKTPVWFTEENGRLYVMTMQQAGKLKRIRNNPRVLVGPSDARGTPLGPTATGTALILSNDHKKHIEQMLNKKYGLFKLVFDFFGMIGRNLDSRAYIEIAPEAE